MTARVIMLQGTGSDVGKSTLVAALCRYYASKGLRVAPFKAQNMSNNAAVCPDGGEIGRAQALQAQAARIAPHPDMNPILLKPENDRAAQVIVQGKVLGRQDAAEYFAGTHSLLPAALESFHRLCQRTDLVIVEGAGSAAEVNLRARDIANMGFAAAAGIPVVLVGDIDRGGVIASVVGTKEVISPADAAYIRGFLINKFRGDPTLFDNGMTFMAERTGWRALGLIPWIGAAARLPAEDAVVLERPSAESAGALRIRAPMLSRIANFDDADPLAAETGVDFQWVPPGQPIPRDCDVIALFGTKSTLDELAFLKSQGWDQDIKQHARHGGRVIGLCGGYQMLGTELRDPMSLDGQHIAQEGLGLLAVSTEMAPEKTLRNVSSRCAVSGSPVDGYEIHLGSTEGRDCSRPMFSGDGTEDGARSDSGLVEGTYLHGIFGNDEFRRGWLERAGLARDDETPLNFNQSVEDALDELTSEFAQHADLDKLLTLAEVSGWRPE